MAGGIGGLSSSGPRGHPIRRAPGGRGVQEFTVGRYARQSTGHAIRELPVAERPARTARPARPGRADLRGADRAAVGERGPRPLGRGPRHGRAGRPRRPGRAGPARPSWSWRRSRGRRGQGGPARRRLRARPPTHGRLAGRSLVDPRPARHRRAADPADGPARARGAAGRDPRHEEPRAARPDRLPGQRQLVAGARRRALPRRRPAQCRERDPRAQPPQRRPHALPGRPAPHRRGPRRRPPAGHRRCSTTS